MRLKLIACKAMMREVCYLAATSPHFIDITFLRQGLHDTPKVLKQQLQVEIDNVDSGEDMHSSCPKYIAGFDAILLGYGLCSNALDGLHSQKYTLVLPRVHDCIALLMGSQRAYRDAIADNNGVYYYTPSWIENAFTPGEDNYRAKYNALAAQYGEENAEYIMQAESNLPNYNTCAYIAWEELPFPQYEAYTQAAAEYLGFTYKKIRGDKSFLRDFLNGKFDERFLIVPPVFKVQLTYDTDIFLAVPLEST